MERTRLAAARQVGQAIQAAVVVEQAQAVRQRASMVARHWTIEMDMPAARMVAFVATCAREAFPGLPATRYRGRPY